MRWVHRGLAAFLRAKPDLLLVGEAAGGEKPSTLCERLQPDVVLMDLMMPGMSGTEATGSFAAAGPISRSIALTGFGDREIVREALAAGALSYLLKNVSAEDLAEAIRAACSGRSTLANEAVQALVQLDEELPVADELTPREREVLALMVKGLTNPEIAGRLIVSRATAKAHVSNVLAKLGAANRAEAVAIALQRKLVS